MHTAEPTNPLPPKTTSLGGPAGACRRVVWLVVCGLRGLGGASGSQSVCNHLSCQCELLESKADELCTCKGAQSLHNSQLQRSCTVPHCSLTCCCCVCVPGCVAPPAAAAEAAELLESALSGDPDSLHVIKQHTTAALWTLGEVAPTTAAPELFLGCPAACLLDQHTWTGTTRLH